MLNINADNKFENIYKTNIEKIDVESPNIKAWFFVTFPVGIGLKHVLVINASRSASYHIFKHPAAPEPSATKIIAIIASKVSKFELEVNKPTEQVNITRDITLGFINNISDLIKILKSNSVTLFFIALSNKVNPHLL